MFRKKVYGQSKVEKCPFCGKTATTENLQGVPTCISHKSEELVDFKCMCGEWLEMKKSKWGPFFLCMHCGPISYKKGMEVNEHLLEQKRAPTAKVQEKKTEEKKTEKKPEKRKSAYDILDDKDEDYNPKKKKETVITSDEVDLYYS
jgi:hypothetical protein